MTSGSRKVHDFCWINLMTPDAPKARAFFTRLFGWTYGDMPGVPGGELIQVEGRTAGAFMDLAASQMPPGTPASIGVMVKVASTDETCAKIVALGGRVEGPWDALENGRMALCTDPTGAKLGLWQPKQEDGFEHDSHAHGAPNWFEALTTDAARAVPFYEALFGWKTERQELPGRTYLRFMLDGVPIGGALQLPARAANVPSHWGTYFAVKNVDETVRVGMDSGAELCLPAEDIAGVGRFAMLKSPQGVPFHVIQYASSTARS